MVNRNERSIHGQTAIELGCCIIPFIVGGICAYKLRQVMGWPGIPIGFISGFLVTLLIYKIDNYITDAEWFQYGRPYCTCGNRFFDNVEEDNYDVYKCPKCGTVYTNDDRSCDILLPDGTKKPYMKRVRFLPWRYVKEVKRGNQ